MKGSSLDYARVAQTQINSQILQGMRVTLLQSQFLKCHIRKSIERQDLRIRRAWQDRVLQLSELSEQCVELELANLSRLLIIKLEQLIDVEQGAIEGMWPKLDQFLAYLNRTRQIVTHCCRKLILGPQLGIDVGRLNHLISLTKKAVAEFLEKNSTKLGAIGAQKMAIQRVFVLMQKYCKQMSSILQLTNQKYDNYILNRLKKEESRVTTNIQQLTSSILN